jgi:flagellin-like hook-associated protein FlgL
MPEAIVEYTTQQTAYETALRAAANIIQPSLLNFLN